MSTSSIEWTEQTWNPVTGCTIVSEGCRNCYAMRMAARLEAMGQKKYEGTTKKVGKRAVWTGKVNLIYNDLAIPLKRNKSTMYFVNSMSDLFHEDVPFEFIAAVFGVMAASDFKVPGKFACHTFQILTKRPERAAEFYKWIDAQDVSPYGRWTKQGALCARLASSATDPNHAALIALGSGRWPLGNVWLGTSCEDQKTADERIPDLLKCPAAVRFLSCEPLLEMIDLEHVGPENWDVTRGWKGNANNDRGWANTSRVDWVIVGGESGPGARPCDVQWVRSIVALCKDAELPVFVKQLGAKPFDSSHSDIRFDGRLRWRNVPDPSPKTDYARECLGSELTVAELKLKDSKGGNIDEWPQDLRVREFPKAKEAVAS